MKKMKLPVLYVLIIMILLSACQGTVPDNTANTRTIVDVWGRQVEIPMEVESIITLGPGATRIGVYLGVHRQIIGTETQTQSLNPLMDFSPIVHEYFANLPIVGRGGGGGENNAYPEEIIRLAPDVILAAFTPQAADELQAQTGIPVVAVRYTSTGLANESFFAASRVFAQVMGQEERGEALLEQITLFRTDLERRTADIDPSGRLRVYAGAITFAGQRGFGGTYSQFGPLVAIGAYNVADTALEEGFYEVDFEQIMLWDPEIIFLDPGNIHLVQAEYEARPQFFHALSAVREGRVYTMPAFNFSATNVTYALINAYFAGTILFPEEFADIDIREKAGEILSFFLGEDTFSYMEAAGLVYGQIRIGE